MHCKGLFLKILRFCEQPGALEGAPRVGGFLQVATHKDARPEYLGTVEHLKELDYGALQGTAGEILVQLAFECFHLQIELPHFQSKRFDPLLYRLLLRL